MKFLFLLLLPISYVFAEINEDFIQKNFQKLSHGISCILVDKQVGTGSKAIIHSITELTSEIAKINFTEADKKEIEKTLAQFDVQLETILQTKTKGDKDKELLSDGLAQLISNVFLLVFLRKNIGYYIKNIIAALLKIIIAILDDASPDHSELVAVHQALQEALNKQVLCLDCKTN